MPCCISHSAARVVSGLLASPVSAGSGKQVGAPSEISYRGHFDVRIAGASDQIGSIAILRSDQILQDVLKRHTLQQTHWYKSTPGIERLNDLKARLSTSLSGSSLISISFSGKNLDEPPVIVEEIIAVYLKNNELMLDLFDPIADDIFNAVGSEVSDTGGVVDIRPTTDEDWDKVMRAAVTIAEGTNLLKIHPRPAVPEAARP